MFNLKEQKSIAHICFLKYDLWKIENKKQEKQKITIIPIENMLNKWVSSLHIYILIGACLTEDFIKIKNMLKKKFGFYRKRHFLHHYSS